MSELLWYVILFGISVAGATNSDLFTLTHRIPRYLQANMTFANAKLYFQRNLPYDDTANVIDKNRGFAALCGITGKLVQADIVNQGHYDPRDLVKQYSDYARQNYNEIARATNELIVEANTKVAPIINLINSECAQTTFSNCNEKIDARVISNPYAYRMPAKLFIHLGKLSKNIMRNEILIEKLINNNEIVSYLSLHATDTSIEKIIKKMARTYTILKMMNTIYF